ncbi:MAG: riboflavin synthase [Planctomycetota bacterium]|nr:riboflavin synthase [Planctomycetota bacterium]
MFTGLIEACVPVTAIEPLGTGLRVTLRAPEGLFAAAKGQSIAVSGACLTHVGSETAGAPLVFELSEETLERTWFRALAPGKRVNLERALRLGDRLDGHLVAGHVDGAGRICAIEPWSDGGARLVVEVPAGFERYLLDKGSITIDGVSLTVVSPCERTFAVALIPLTLAKTTLGEARVGDLVNLEADMVGKWILSRSQG